MPFCQPPVACWSRLAKGPSARASRVLRWGMVRLPTIGLVLLASLACAGPSGAGRIATGPWGGEHVLLTVKDAGADVEFDCAHGRIEEPLVLDDQKQFDARGVFVRERGGPVRQGQTEDTIPARYKGTVNGDAMDLTVTPEGSDSVGPFSLARGARARLVKCL
jgi:hypothetical protein